MQLKSIVNALHLKSPADVAVLLIAAVIAIIALGFCLIGVGVLLVMVASSDLVIRLVGISALVVGFVAVFVEPDPKGSGFRFKHW
jgi:hypothetical protein